MHANGSYYGLSKYLKYTIAIVMLVFFVPAIAQKRARNIIPSINYSIQQLDQIIAPSWDPFPELTDPQKINSIPVNIRQAYIRQAEKLLTITWAPLSATVFMEYNRAGDRSHYEELSFARRRNLAILVLAEVFERKGRFTDQIVNGIWAICEESFWGVPAHLNLQKAGFGLPDVDDPVVDLFASETGSELAWVYYLLRPELDKVSPLITDRIDHEVNRHILDPYLKHTDWAYLGFQWRMNPDSLRRVNNWNPWINSNVLAAALILAKGEQRNRVIQKTLQSITNFMEPFPADGGSDEGPQYWLHSAGALLDYFEQLKSASNGKIDVFNERLIKNMGSYIYKTYISDQYFFNYADADAKVTPDAGLLYRFGKQIKDDTLLHFAAFVAKRSNYGKDTLQSEFGVLNRVLPGLHVINELLATEPREPLLKDTWLPEVQVMAARSNAGNNKGLYLAVKGGNNGTSHNHNDIGNFIVYADGFPVLIDAGAQTYTSQTFSDKRYQLWNNTSSWHNLPAINGVMQSNGGGFYADHVVYKQSSSKASISMNIAPAYPSQAQVDQWTRTITLYRGKQIQLEENITLKTCQGPTTENFITPISPDISVAGSVTLSNGKVKCHLYYDAKKFNAYTDRISVPDKNTPPGEPTISERMEASWGKALYRIRLISKSNILQDKWSIKIQ